MDQLNKLDFSIANKFITVFVLLLVCASPVRAEWLSLFQPQNSPLLQQAGGRNYDVGAKNYDVGRDAFLSFGCGECHSQLQGGSYETGFRIVQKATSNLVGRVDNSLGFPKSPIITTEQVRSLTLGEREYLQSSSNSAVYLRKVHQSIPGVEPSLTLLEAANASDQTAAVEYILVF